MEGILRFEQETGNWFVDGEITLQLEPHSCPGNLPTDILNNDGLKINFGIVTLSFDDGQEKNFASTDLCRYKQEDITQ